MAALVFVDVVVAAVVAVATVVVVGVAVATTCLLPVSRNINPQYSQHLGTAVHFVKNMDKIEIFMQKGEIIFYDKRYFRLIFNHNI